MSSEVQEILDTLQMIDPSDFVKIVANLLEKLGYKDVFIVDSPGDKGIDIEATFETPIGSKKRIAVQVKRYTKNLVGEREIRYFKSAIDDYGYDEGIYVTTSRFTKNAFDVASRSNIQLIDGFNLSKLIIKYNIKIPISRLIETKTQNLQLGYEEHKETKRTRINLRDIELDVPIYLPLDLYDIKPKIFSLIHRNYEIDPNKINILSAILHITPYYIVEWKFYKEGYDEMGRRRLRVHKGLSLVNNLGTSIIDFNKLNPELRNAILRTSRRKRSIIYASRIISEKGIGKREVRSLIKNYLANKNKIDKYNIDIIKIKVVYLGTFWDISLDIGLNTAEVNYDLLTNKITVNIDPLEEQFIYKILNNYSLKRIGEKIIDIKSKEDYRTRTKIIAETSRFNVYFVINKYSGSIIESKTDIKYSSAKKLALSLINGNIINEEENQQQYIFDIENINEISVIRIERESGKYYVKRGLLNLKKTLEISSEFIKNTYKIEDSEFVNWRFIKHKFWEIYFVSEDGRGNIRVDAETGEVIDHSIIFSERKVRKIIWETYPDKNIVFIDFNQNNLQYMVKIEDSKRMHELSVDATNGHVRIIRTYLKKEIIKSLADSLMLEKFNENNYNLIDIKLEENKWKTVYNTGNWIYTLFFEMNSGELINYEKILSKEGAISIVIDFVYDNYNIQDFRVEYVGYNNKTINGISLKLRSTQKIMYFRLDKFNGKIIEQDIIDTGGFLSNIKSKMKALLLDKKYEIK